MLSQEQLDHASNWGLSPNELDNLAERLRHDIDTVCDAVRVLLPESARDVVCTRHAQVSVGSSGQLVMVVSAAWWPTGNGGDDLLEIAYTVTWPREIDVDVTIECDVAVTEWGSLFPYAEQRVRSASADARIVMLAPAVDALRQSLIGREQVLADAIRTLRQHGGRWPQRR